jgi:hypothetical protein
MDNDPGDSHIQTKARPLEDLLDTFPSKLHVLYAPAKGKYGCFCSNGIHGLAVFEHQLNALAFGTGMEEHEKTPTRLRCVSFDRAREIAKSRPEPVNALILLDEPDKPRIHFVK